MMCVVTSGIVRPRWRVAMRSGGLFLVGGGLGIVVYGLIAHPYRLVGASAWGGLVFGAAVAATTSALFPGRGRR